MANYLVDKFLMAGGALVTDEISGAAFTKTGGVGNAWTDASNFLPLLGASAPVIAQTNNNLLTNAVATFTPYTGWTAKGAHQVSAQGPADDNGSGSFDLTSAGGDAYPGLYVFTGAVLTVGQPYTCSFRMKAANAGAVGTTGLVVLDEATAPFGPLTTNWQTYSCSNAAIGYTSVAMQMATNG